MSELRHRATVASLSHGTLSEEIAERLINSIVGGKFRFGEKLPPERDLARYFGVGRPTIREAIRRLTFVGLLEIRRGEGTFVVNSHLDFVSRAFGWTVLLDPQTASEVVEVRLAIESEIAGLAASRATPDVLRRLTELVEVMKQSQGNPKQFSSADLAFHMTLAESAENVTLVRILQAIRSLLRQWISRALETPSAYAGALEHHQRILLAVTAGDQHRARESMREHLEAMGELLTTDIARQSEQAASRVRPE